MPVVDILIPTCNRLESLVMTLSGVCCQTVADVHLVVSDQGDVPVRDSPVVRTLLRVIEARAAGAARADGKMPLPFDEGEAPRALPVEGATGYPRAGVPVIEWFYRAPSKGIAEQRHFLLGRAFTDHVLYLDDDVLMEPWVLATLLETIEEEGCGFVGAFPAGISFRDDVRPDQQRIDYWHGRVRPEAVEPGSAEWERWHLHRAANLYHASRSIPPGGLRRYKVAWIASCILYDRQKLLDVGGYAFWDRLPRYHSGEEVLVQNLLMRRWGGCAIAPSGTYYSELPSTVLNGKGTVDGHALDLLPEMVERYGPRP